MNRTLKTFLLLLLMAALPLQGAAAAMRLSCGPNQHLPAPTASAAHHHDSAMHADADHALFDAGASTTASAAGLDKVPTTSDVHQHSSCSSCAACCVGAAAPPSTVISTPTHTDSELVVISPSPLVTGFIPAGLERPPKRISA